MEICSGNERLGPVEVEVHRIRAIEPFRCLLTSKMVRSDFVIYPDRSNPVLFGVLSRLENNPPLCVLLPDQFCENRLNLKGENTVFSVGQVGCQGFFNDREGDLIPGDFVFTKQADLGAFGCLVKVRAF